MGGERKIAVQGGKDGGNEVTRRLGTSMKSLALIVFALLVFPSSLPAQGVAPASKPPQAELRSSENIGQGVAEINELTKLAHEGGTLPLTTTPVALDGPLFVAIRV
jgi:hypothetical protein